MKQSTLHLVSSVLVTIALILWVGCGKDGAGDASSNSKYKEELAKIREALDQLEGNRAPDVIDVEANG